MKEFNLEKALAGEPVALRNGKKAFIFKNILDTSILSFKPDYPLIGMMQNNTSVVSWTLDGRIEMCNDHSNGDIVGMFEEPKLTSEQVLEKAYQEDLIVLCDGYPDLPLKIIAKTKDGEFVMQPEDDTIQPWLANLTMEWFFAKDLDPKFDTITNTNTIALPKPFKPKDGEPYFYITGGFIECESEFWDTNNFDMASAERGGCFRTREDAQKWIDFMKSMME